MIEAFDPGRGGMQQCRLLADHQDGVQATNRLKFYEVLAETVVAGIHDLFELRDHGVRTAVDDRKNSDRLTAHPVEAEAHPAIHRRATLRAPAVNEHQVSRHVAPDP